MKDYMSANPLFSENISIVEESDLVNADNNNAAAKQLLQNDLVLMSSKVDKEDGKNLVADAERNAWNQTYQQSTGYTDQKIAELINGAPSTLDTLGEIADAMQENSDVVEALDAAIGTKANQAEMESLLGTKLDTTGDSKDNTVTFASSDTQTPSAWTDVAVLKSGETHKSILGKLSSMFKNMRYLWKLLGSTDISTIADGTVTGALNELNTGMTKISARIGKQHLILNAQETILVKLSTNNIYLVSVQNSYNVGGLFLVQTGGNANECKIITIYNMDDNHFKLEPVGIESFNVKTGEVSGYLNALQLNL